MAWNRRRRGAASGSWAFIAHNPWLAVFFVVALGILVAGRGQDALFEDFRNAANDASVSVMSVIAEPASEVKKWGDGIGSFLQTYEENQRLRAENSGLRAAQGDLVELQRKVQRYEELLKIPADAPVSAVAARVIADTSSPFVRTVLLNVGQAQGAAKGQAVVDDRGLLGRVIGTGKRSSRVLLLTDLNSRIPVIIEGANLKAILAGDNSGKPTLEYLPSGSRIVAGARVVTTSDGAAFPPGIAIGTVAKGETSPRVQLYTNEGRADFVRVLNYKAPVDVDDAPETAPEAPDGKPKPASTGPAAATRPQTAGSGQVGFQGRAG